MQTGNPWTDTRPIKNGARADRQSPRPVTGGNQLCKWQYAHYVSLRRASPIERSLTPEASHPFREQPRDH